MKHFSKYLGNAFHEETKIEASDAKKYGNKHDNTSQEAKSKGETIQNIQRVK